MIKARTISAMAMMCLGCANAVTLEEVRQYKNYERQQTVVFEQNFNDPGIFENPRYRNGDFHVEKGVGVSGTNGLVFERKDPENYTPLGIALPPMKNDQVYVFSVRARWDGKPSPIPKDKHGRTRRNPGLLCWEYKPGPVGSYDIEWQGPALADDWQEFSMETRCRDGFSVEESWLTFYVHRGLLGRIVFDELMVTTLEESHSLLMLHPANRAVTGSWTDLIFTTNGKAGAKELL